MFPTMLKPVVRKFFGPVVHIEKVSDFYEGIEKTSDSLYGINAGIFTRDMRKIMDAYNLLEVGGVIVNDYPTFRVENMPYGGVKESGIGREGVRYAIEEMTELKLMIVSLANWKV
jgi:NAD-dependent aldehyde dehydrogenases